MTVEMDAEYQNKIILMHLATIKDDLSHILVLLILLGVLMLIELFVKIYVMHKRRLRERFPHILQDEPSVSQRLMAIQTEESRPEDYVQHEIQ